MVQARLKNPGSDILWLAAVHTEQRTGNAKAAETLLAKGLQVHHLNHQSLWSWCADACSHLQQLQDTSAAASACCASVLSTDSQT